MGSWIRKVPHSEPTKIFGMSRQALSALFGKLVANGDRDCEASEGFGGEP